MGPVFNLPLDGKLPTGPTFPFPNRNETGLGSAEKFGRWKEIVRFAGGLYTTVTW